MTDKVLASSVETSPDALLKQAILGARASAGKTSDKPSDAVATRSFHFEPRLAGFCAAALGLGALLGAGAMSLATPSGTEGLSQVRQQLEATRTESERQIERLGKSFAQLQESSEVARSEAKTRSTALGERIGRTEQAITNKMTQMGDRLDQAGKDQTARLVALTTQVEKRTVPVATATASVPAPQAAKAAAPEPTETGSLSDKNLADKNLADRAKSAPADNWAVRDVYDGIAVLEDRKRRLVEVGPGDTVPGVGRIEGIERRGRTWVVVTKHGTITPQAW